MEIKLIVLSLALLLDRFVGDPPQLWQRMPHPVVLFGKAISWGEKRWNNRNLASAVLRRNGMWLTVGLVAVCVILGLVLEFVLPFAGTAGAVAEILIVTVLLAQKSLADHVQAVALALREDGLEGGRRAVSMIVGRNPEHLDEGGISRAAIESLAENASDGIVAPAFWFLVGGLPGLFAYKMINTADSMIGHLNDRYRDFGRFAAKLDDVANYIPARLTGLLASLATAITKDRLSGREAFSVMRRDARLHRSPNAGWPESAFAGGLGLALAGPRQYGTEKVEGPMLNASGKRDANANDIDAALHLFWSTMSLMTGLVIAASLIGLLVG
ncbi:adenosylcobinamide-phosphate synthase CbiB [Brucella intermedia]|uniref:Cobalamin biosynthesis protein CobD n=1 Tax=Brucella intermedia TaxID=94625 RepID=A0A7V6TXU6_9HYPH|nr:adenosylcobinamide-phosphate synthase CbiB [Brucella intermedia]PJR94411.1 adenosylcobinamide-phosphate synthase [Ochrobactrum sp. 721/2009]PJT17695.1 adenosylcobinamide-phosphate synthase [Ochrobactrum sp. 720/2009]PJT31043.1 adenosylcobinamide-phosphate synthase [Ochrobactrum sp. 695/2009]PJT33057.1 adenosylcobinamide-phosphate synthase [Ochrobactrum sp. 689/2009]WGG58641.1 adenosylcobinamide-phosphate synthase CbiB [Brucella intermedia]